MSTKKTKNINTVYLGKQVCVQIEEVKNTGSIPAQDTYVELTLPEGVSFESANLPVGTYDLVTNRWNLGTLLPSQQYTGEVCFEITNECLSTFKFEFQAGSSSACQSCAVLSVQCLVLQGQSCCEIDNCGFSKFGSETYDLACPDPIPTEPTNPPENAIDEQYHVQFYQNCEVWFQYDAENEIWNVVNGVVVGTGSVSSMTKIVSGNPIAQHDNNAGTATFIDETITGITDQVVGQKIGTYAKEDGGTDDINETVTSLGSLINGHKIGDYTREDGAVQDIDETITTVTDTVAGNLIATYTDEDGGATEIDETITTVTNTVAGHLIGRYTGEDGTPYDIDETITGIAENADGTLTYTDENSGTTDVGPQFSAGYLSDISLGSTGDATIPFPFTFSTAPVVVVTPTDPPFLYYPTVTSVTTTEFTVKFNATIGTVVSFNWIAMVGVEFVPSPTPTPSVTPTPTATPTPTVTPSTSPP